MRGSYTLVSMILCLALAFPAAMRAQDKPAGPAGKEDGIKEQLQKDEKLRLTLDRVLQYLLTRNLDVQKALLDYRGADSELRKYRALYDTKLYGKGAYSVTENSPDNPSTMFSGKEITAKTFETGISKYFNSGTSVSLSLNGLYQNVTGAGIPMTPITLGGEGYQSTFMVKVSQELLKNSFGVRDRLTERMIENAAEMNRRAVKQYLSTLLVEALAGYWNVAVAEEALNTSKISLSLIHISEPTRPY